MRKICTICGKPVGKGQPCLKSKKIVAHTECFQAEPRELKAEREAKA